MREAVRGDAYLYSDAALLNRVTYYALFSLTVMDIRVAVKLNGDHRWIIALMFPTKYKKAYVGYFGRCVEFVPRWHFPPNLSIWLSRHLFLYGEKDFVLFALRGLYYIPFANTSLSLIIGKLEGYLFGPPTQNCERGPLSK